MQSHLLTVKDMQSTYRLGRDLSFRLAHLLPRVRVGSAGRGRARVLIRRDHVETLLDRATTEDLSLWELVRRPDAQAVVAGWLGGEEVN